MTEQTIEVDPLINDLRVALRRYRARTRRRASIGIAVLVTGVAASGIALGATYGDWWSGGEPAVNSVVVDQQLTPTSQFAGGAPVPERALARTVAEIPGAALVAAPTKQGGYCLIPSLSGQPDLGFYCDDTPASPSGAGSDFDSYANNTTWIAYGRITDTTASSIGMNLAGQPIHAQLQRGGFFLFDVPQSAWASIDNARSDLTVLNSSGAVVRTTCVAWGPSPAQRGGSDYPSEGSGPDCADQTPPTPASFEPIKTPFPIPTISGTDILSGRSINNGDFGGSPGFLVIWSSYCSPCSAELSVVQEFVHTNPTVRVIGLDADDLPTAAGKLLQQLKIRFPSIPADTALIDELGLTGFPTVLAFDSQGNITATEVGLTSSQDLQAELKQLSNG